MITRAQKQVLKSAVQKDCGYFVFVRRYERVGDVFSVDYTVPFMTRSQRYLAKVTADGEVVCKRRV